jgi:Class II flagellar assembly regulator
MSGIDGIGRATPTRSSARAKRPETGGFAVPAESSATGHAEAATQTEEVALTSMLSLQEFGGDAAADHEASRRGEDMLSALAELQRALLGGVDTVETMQRLAELAAAVPRAANPQLAALVSAISIRVRVELARRGG